MGVNLQLKDEIVIPRVLQGEVALYEVIIRRYNPYLYKVGRSYGFGHEDTEDLMQDSFVDAYKSLANFEGRSAFKSWITRIMLNNCYRRRHKASTVHEVMNEVNEHAKPLFSDDSDETGKVVRNNELRKIIETTLTEIPYKYRMVFSLREINAMSIAETAELLDISHSNVKVRLSRAKEMLRKKLESNYSSVELFEFNLVYCDAIVNNVMERIKGL